MAYPKARYGEEERRRRWSRAAATRPSASASGFLAEESRALAREKGWADWRRRAALLVVAVALLPATASSSRLARLAITPSAAAGG